MPRKSKTHHDSMILSLVAHLENDGYSSVKADHIGGDQPAQINWKNGGGHIPDVQANKAGKTHIFEVETADSIEDEHTADQFRLFAAAARNWADYAFHILVPKDSKPQLNRLLQQLNITAKVWTI